MTNGDCEDFALEKRRRLIQIGFPWQQLRVCILRVESSYLHAILIVHTDKGDFCMDLGNNAVNPINAFPIYELWKLLWIQDENGSFRHVKI